MNSNNVDAHVKPDDDDSHATQCSLYPFKYTTSYALRCKCKKHHTCMECRYYWVEDKKRSNVSMLRRFSNAYTQLYTVTLTHRTIPHRGAWAVEAKYLWDCWSKLCKMRSNDRNGKTAHGLESIRCAMVAVHHMNDVGAWFPHLHGVFVCSEFFKPDSLSVAWSKLAGSEASATVEETITLVGSVKYAIDGSIPSDPQERLALAKSLFRKRSIRHMR